MSALTVDQHPLFAPLKPPMSVDHALEEAHRCLYCYDAPCTSACPTAIDVPEFIRRIATGNLAGSARVIFESNPLGASCARVCPTEVLCEGACVYNQLGMPPIAIGRLQRVATDHVMERGVAVRQRSSSPRPGRVAVIGAGPAGIACASELALLGHQVVVFEEKQEPGGLNRYGVAPYKLTAREALEEVRYLQEMSGFEIRCGVRVGTDLPLEELERDYDAVFLGIGLGASKKLGIPGEEKEGVVGATEFIEELRSRPCDEFDPGRRVVVVGAGNTALDAANEAARLGAEEVTVVYRRGEQEMPAYAHEYELALEHGVRFLWYASPVEVLGEDRVTGLRCVRTRPGEPDSSGRPRPVPVEGSEFVIPADRVIRALGQEIRSHLLSSIPGLEVRQGRVVVDSEYRTTRPGYYAGGDCINGGKEVVNAAAHGRDAARAIHRFLNEKGGA